MNGRYATIVCDPPWHYDDKPTSWGHEKSRRSFLPYRTMTVEQIAGLDVAGLAADDCRLFLWTTNRYLHDAFHVVEAWGFAYQQTLVWCKRPMGAGPGAVASQTSEYVLIAKRGSPPRGQLRLRSSWWQWKRPYNANGGPEHSRKPDAFLDLVEQISDGPRLEMFARRQRLGWDTWGDEALCHVDLAVPTPV